MKEKTRPRRTQAERTQQRKEQLIREATRYFGQYGYRGAKLAEIARAAGVTEPGLLHHFPSKEHLLMEVLAERDRLDKERFDPALHGATGDPFPSYEQLVSYNETVPGLVQLFSILVAESIEEQHPGHDFFRRRYQNLREQTIPLIKNGQKRGEIRKDISAEELSILIFAVMDGLQIQWLYEPETIHMAHVFEQFVKLVKPS